jgi:amino acid transporter
LATYLAIGIILLTSLYIIIYSHKDAWNFLPKLNPTSEGNQLEMNNGNKYRNYQETKNTIIGAGATLVAVTMISLFLVPSFMARKYLEEDQNGINFGWGRAWTYIGRMTMAVLSFLILPFVIIVNNRKMRKVLLRQLKDMFV